MIKLNIDLPENFLEEEVRSGYLVKKEIKELWAVQLDLLMELDRVCKKNDIRYFVMFGSLLGAVRHKGFIPWDDDIDVVVSREDFKKLEKAKDDFKNPYFFQTDYTDPGCHTFFAKLRNSDTAAILRPEIECKYTYNQGIFIDIFIMDNVPDDEEEFKAHKGKIKKAMVDNVRFARAFQGRRFYSRHKWAYVVVPVVYFLKAFVKLFGIKNFALKHFDKLANKYNHLDTYRWSHLGLGEEFTYPREWFDEVVYLDFENQKIPCPKEYEKILTERYGNWKEFVIGTQVHTISIIDVEKSYKEYL